MSIQSFSMSLLVWRSLVETAKPQKIPDLIPELPPVQQLNESGELQQKFLDQEINFYYS